jgi:DNA-binding beta-propeller fold protein YncE
MPAHRQTHANHLPVSFYNAPAGSSREGHIVLSRVFGLNRSLRPMHMAVLAVAVIASVWLAVGATGAVALEARPLEFEIGSVGEGAGQLSDFQTIANSPIAVDQSTGDVYIGDSGNDRVEKYTSSGVFILMFGGHVDESTGANVCTAASGDTCQAGSPDPSPTGNGNGYFGARGESTTGIAVNQATHDVYVTDRAARLVEIFTDAGAFVSQFTAPVDAEVRGGNALAIDSLGNVYVADGNGCGCVRKYGSTGAPDAALPTIGFGTLLSAFALAVDSENNLYVVDAGANSVQKFTASGTLVSTGNYAFGLDNGNEPRGIAVAPATNDVYVLDSGLNEVLEYSDTGEKLSDASPLKSFELTQARGIALNGATGDLLIGKGAKDTVGVFGAPVVLADATTEPATNLSPAGATLNGAVNPDSTTVTACRFVFGADASYGRSAPCAETVGSGASAVPVHADITGLTPNTTYHVRLEVTNTSGTNTGEDQTFTTTGPPTICEALVAEPGQQSATVRAGIDPDGFSTGYRIEYGTTAAYGASAPVPDASLGPESECKSISVAIAGLRLASKYHYRIVAHNTAGTIEGPDQSFETLPAALIESQSVSDVAASSATLEAQINPLGSATAYRFEYGPSTSYGASVPVPAAEIGSGSVGVPVLAHLQRLAAATLYHFRVVASNALGTSAGPDETLLTQSIGLPSALPDARQWEMVTPPNKQTAAVEAISEQSGLIVAAANGDALAYTTTAPDEPDPQGALDETQELSVRGSSGWGQQTITIPHTAATGHSIGYGPEYRFFSNDLTQAIVQPFGPFNPSLSNEASEQTAFLRTNFPTGNVGEACTSSCYRPLVTGAPAYANVPAGTKFGSEIQGSAQEKPDCVIGCGPNFVAATADLSHVIVSSGAVGLTPGSEGGLYEWSAGRLTFVGRGEVGYPGEGHNAISEDGSRVVLDGAAGGVEGLLLRDTVTGETVKLDAVVSGGGEGTSTPHFQGASSDGARVFFTDTQRLTDSSGESDLYECQIVVQAGRLACALSDLTPLHSGESAQVQGEILGLSEDGSWVYFVAGGVLAPGAVAGPNLYVLHFDGTHWEAPKLISVLSAADNHDWSNSTGGQPTRVSPSGEWLAFMSQRQITSYDNRDARSGEPDAEVYLYDANTDALLCPSCDPTGARPVGVPYTNLESALGGVTGGANAWEPAALVAANVPGWQQTQIGGQDERYQSRYLADSGRLFFNSDDALSPQDVNGTEDVYEYEPPTIGGCSRTSTAFAERSQGCVALISSGTSPRESGFLDASESGGDVFFLTSESLLPQDFDSSLDIYDAHECSASAACLPTPAAQPPTCTTGDQCKAAPSPQPASFGSPASQTFSGAGNLTSGKPAVAVKPKALRRAQKLARALKACRAKAKRKRASCQRQAQRAYGPTHKVTAKKGKGKR